MKEDIMEKHIKDGNLLIAEEFIKTKYNVNTSSEVAVGGLNLTKLLVEFAKIHVKQALENAVKMSLLHVRENYGTYEDSSPDKDDVITHTKCIGLNKYGHGDCTYKFVTIDDTSILNAYPEELIK